MGKNYLTVVFNRFNGCAKPRGTVVDHPYTEDQPLSDVGRLIAVRILASSIPEGLENNPTVRLKLDELLGNTEYQPDDVTSTDEEGGTMTVTPPHYFAEDGVSSRPFPVITMNEVAYE